MLPQPKLKIEAAASQLSPRKGVNNGFEISPNAELNSKLPLKQTKMSSKLPPTSPRPGVGYKNIASSKKQHSESDCKAKTGIPMVSKRTQPGRPGFKYGDVDLKKYKQKPLPKIAIETKQNDFERHLQGGESNFLHQKQKVETFTKEANKENDSMAGEMQVSAQEIKPKYTQIPHPRILTENKEDRSNFLLQKEKVVTSMEEGNNDASVIEDSVCDTQIQTKDIGLGLDSDPNTSTENISNIKCTDDDTVDKILSGDSGANRTLNYDTQNDDDGTDSEVVPAKSLSVSLMDLYFEEFPPPQSDNNAEILGDGNSIYTVKIGTEILNQIEQLYIQKKRTRFFDNCIDRMKFNPQIKCQIFEDLTNSPILNVTQKRNELGKYFVGYDSIQFIVRAGPGLSSTELQSQSVALVINCLDCPVTGCVLHTAEVFICDGMIKLGSCEFLSCEPSSTSLLLKNIITAEGFVVRFSSESGDPHPNFKVFECSDLDNPETPADPLDDEKDGPIVSCISVKSPEECLAITFTAKLSSLSKALILSGALLINYDILKNQ